MCFFSVLYGLHAVLGGDNRCVHKSTRLALKAGACQLGGFDELQLVRLLDGLAARQGLDVGPLMVAFQVGGVWKPKEEGRRKKVTQTTLETLVPLTCICCT
jgi:hypothetical protein